MLSVKVKFRIDYELTSRGGARSGKVWECEAGLPDPLHHPVHEIDFHVNQLLATNGNERFVWAVSLTYPSLSTHECPPG